MSDKFKDHIAGLESPASMLHAVTPDDGADLPFASRALNVAGSGAVRITTVSGNVGTVFIGAGSAFPIRAVRVWASGTTATGIVVMS